MIGELCPVPEVKEELALLHEQSSAEGVLQFFMGHRFHLLPAESQVRPHHMSNHGNRIFYLKHPESSVSRDVLEGEDSLSLDLAVPHLKLENKRHSNCDIIIMDDNQQSHISYSKR